jgi:hypothetical protein
MIVDYETALEALTLSLFRHGLLVDVRKAWLDAIANSVGVLRVQGENVLSTRQK